MMVLYRKMMVLSLTPLKGKIDTLLIIESIHLPLQGSEGGITILL